MFSLTMLVRILELMKAATFATLLLLMKMKVSLNYKLPPALPLFHLITLVKIPFVDKMSYSIFVNSIVIYP